MPDEISAHARRLVDEVDAAIEDWVVTVVERRIRGFHGRPPTPREADGARKAGERARSHVVPKLETLLGLDVEEQRQNPLQVLREAVVFANQALADAGVSEVERDAFERRAQPDDVYAIAPATWADLSESLHAPGLAWSAAKAHVIMSRRKQAPGSR